MPENGDLTVLGFDVGSHWTGVAVGQTRTGTASPLPSIRVRQHKPDWNRIRALIEEWQPDRLIVGLPTGMDGQPHAMTEAARRFARQLEGRCHRRRIDCRNLATTGSLNSIGAEHKPLSAYSAIAQDSCGRTTCGQTLFEPPKPGKH